MAFLMYDVFAGPTLVQYLQISNLLLYIQSKHNSMKKETKLLKYWKCFYKATPEMK